MKKITIQEHGCSFGTALDHYKRGSLIKVPEWKNKGLSLEDGAMVMIYINNPNKDTGDFDLAHHVHREDWQVCVVELDIDITDRFMKSFLNTPHNVVDEIPSLESVIPNERDLLIDIVTGFNKIQNPQMINWPIKFVDAIKRAKDFLQSDHH